MNNLALIIALTLITSFAWSTDKEPTRLQLLLASPEIQGAMAFDNGDYETAFSYMLPLAKEGNADAQMLVGYLYEQGLGVLKNDKAAIKWYLLAAKQNDLLAQARLGRMYEKGTGVEKNNEEANKWYALIMAKSNARGFNDIAEMFADDDGRIGDYDAAIKWFRLAAKQGSTNAQTSLGAMYKAGKGVTQSPIRAHMWLMIAALNRDKSSAKMLPESAKALTTKDLSKAQVLAAACVKSKYKDC